MFYHHSVARHDRESGITNNKKIDEQAESIKDKREADANYLRNIYISIIEKNTDENGRVFGTPGEIKNVIEASKNLARLQHLLQVDKTVQKVSEKISAKKEEHLSPKEEHLSPKEKAKLDALIESG
jgi:hypothetical protein